MEFLGVEKGGVECAAGMEGIFIKMLPLALIISTVCWLVGEIIYLSLTISNKKNKK